MIAVLFAILLLAQLGDFKATSAQSQNLVGDNESYEIEQNDLPLLVTGNDCDLRIKNNTASVKIIGNGFLLIIDNNTGPLEWTGNGGNICIGSETAEENVDYTGNNGVMNIVTPDDLSTCLPAETLKYKGHVFRPHPLARQAASVLKPRGVPQYKGTGNGNCIKIPHNKVNFGFDGNNNNVLIQNNSATIHYTGNDGHIYLGSESSMQTVAYSGNGGIVTIVDELDSCSP